TGDQCDQFEDPAGQPFLTCATDNTTNRWNGTMDVTLPTKGDAGFAFSGELQNGTLGNVAAKAEFGHTVPLEEGVYLKSIAAGVCLTPAPLQIRGQAVISALPLGSEEAVEVDGSFHYVDAANGQPWSITLQRGLTMFDHHIADGTLSLDGDDALDVGFDAHVQLPSDDVDAASVDGIRALRLHRTARHTILAWDGSRLASRYEVSATSTEGYQRLYVSPATCRVVSLPASPSSTSVSVTITPIGANGRRGGAAGLRLPVRRVRAGAKAAHPVAGVPRSRCG
ncbi:MAG TPA: hypothetical protein VHW26_07300, partial [Solirubrobacteraceae bacterium]|nr:hypothetical protein [Solirubrobacteraceae bacterium]